VKIPVAVLTVEELVSGSKATEEPGNSRMAYSLRNPESAGDTPIAAVKTR